VTDGDTGVRLAAITAVAAIAPRGHAATVGALLELAGRGGGNGETLPFLRKAAVEALGRVSSVGDSNVVQALLARLNDSSDGVREAAAEALKHVSEQGDDSVVEALLNELLQEDAAG